MTESYVALDSPIEIRKAFRAWRDTFSAGAQKIGGFPKGSTYWVPHLGLWGHFQETLDGSVPWYWNPYGVIPTRLRSNMIVEINPPGSRRRSSWQGLIARGSNGERWILHRGRMSIPGAHISEEAFDKATGRKRISVEFSDGSFSGYHRVARLDGSPTELQNSISQFVADCIKARLTYTSDQKFAEQEANVLVAEASVPELTSSYYVDPQAGRRVDRKHGQVWGALVAALDSLKVPHSNNRVGRWGPDLRTRTEHPILFEIKITNQASDLQRGIGQLLLYEKLLKKKHLKILVLPEKIEGDVGVATQQLNVSVLTFKLEDKIQFSRSAIQQLLESHT